MRTTWQEVDRVLRGFARQRAMIEAEELPWLLEAKRLVVHEHCGYATLHEYLERATGYTPRMVRDRLRMAEAMETLPEMAAAFAAGRLAYSVARSLTQVAAPHTEREWLDAAAGCTAEEVVELVAGRVPGDRPSDAQRPERMLRMLRFEVTPATLALVREAEQVLEHETGEHLDDDALVAAFARAVVAGNGTGLARPPHQLATTICERCDRGWQDAAGTRIEVGRAAIAKAKCDAVHIGSLRDDTPARATPSIPEPTRRMIFRRFHQRCAVPGCRARRFLEIHHIDHDGHLGNHDPSRLVLLCGAHHDLHHHGKLMITGHSPGELHFAHTDGRPYGAPPIDDSVRADAESGLRNLGWDRATSRAAVARAMTQLGRGPSLEALLRLAIHEAAGATSRIGTEGTLGTSRAPAGL